MKLAIALLLLSIAAAAQTKFHETYRRRVTVNVLALSPDGKQVVTDDGNNTQLVTLETGASKNILPGGIQAGNIAFAPDGKSIYYNRAGAKQTWIRETHWLSLVDGATKLLSTGDHSFMLSPDGKWIARLNKGMVTVTAADGSGEPKNVAKDFRTVCAWSPDGETLLLGRFTAERKYELFTVSLRDRVERKVITLPSWVSRVAWPAGQSPYTLRLDSKKWPSTSQIWQISMTDGKFTAVTDDADGFDSLVGASADGEILAAIREVDEGTFFDGLINVFVTFYNVERYKHDLVLLHK